MFKYVNESWWRFKDWYRKKRCKHEEYRNFKYFEMRRLGSLNGIEKHRTNIISKMHCGECGATRENKLLKNFSRWK